MSDTPEIPQNSAPQESKEEKTPVTPSSDPVFSMDQVKKMMEMYMEGFTNILNSKTPTQRDDVINKYQESLKNRVIENQSNLIKPMENQKPKTNALEYVNSVLDKEKEYRNNMESGRMATQHNDPVQILNDKIYILSEFKGNTREEIATVLKDEIEKII